MKFLGYSGHLPQKWCEECYLNHQEEHYKFPEENVHATSVPICGCSCHWHTLGRDFIHAQTYTKTA